MCIKLYMDHYVDRFLSDEEYTLFVLMLASSIA